MDKLVVDLFSYFWLPVNLQMTIIISQNMRKKALFELPFKENQIPISLWDYGFRVIPSLSSTNAWAEIMFLQIANWCEEEGVRLLNFLFNSHFLSFIHHSVLWNPQKKCKKVREITFHKKNLQKSTIWHCLPQRLKSAF